MHSSIQLINLHDAALVWFIRQNYIYCPLLLWVGWYILPHVCLSTCISSAFLNRLVFINICFSVCWRSLSHYFCRYIITLQGSGGSLGYSYTLQKPYSRILPIIVMMAQLNTVKPAYNICHETVDLLAFVDRWLLSTGNYAQDYVVQVGPGAVVVIKRWLPLTITTITRGM